MLLQRENIGRTYTSGNITTYVERSMNNFKHHDAEHQKPTKIYNFYIKYIAVTLYVFLD